MPEETQTLYEKIGGQDVVNKAVDLFYKKILLDGRVAHFFQHTDMRRLYAHQSQFLSVVLGGSKNYKGRNMRDAHADLVAKQGLEERHFDIVAEHLLATLIDLGVDNDIRNDIMAVVASTKNDVLNR